MSENVEDTQPKWVKCPFNPNHQMLESRFQWHIVKCPDKIKNGDKYATCPYNAQHIILKSELTNHKLKCPFRQPVCEENEIDQQIKQYLANNCKENFSKMHSEWKIENDKEMKKSKSYLKNQRRKKNNGIKKENKFLESKNMELKEEENTLNVLSLNEKINISCSNEEWKTVNSRKNDRIGEKILE